MASEDQQRGSTERDHPYFEEMDPPEVDSPDSSFWRGRHSSWGIVVWDPSSSLHQESHNTRSIARIMASEDQQRGSTKGYRPDFKEMFSLDVDFLEGWNRLSEESTARKRFKSASDPFFWFAKHVKPRLSLFQKSLDISIIGFMDSEDRPKGRQSSQGYRPDLGETLKDYLERKKMLLEESAARMKLSFLSRPLFRSEESLLDIMNRLDPMLSLHRESLYADIMGFMDSEDRPKGSQSSQGYRPDFAEMFSLDVDFLERRKGLIGEAGALKRLKRWSFSAGRWDLSSSPLQESLDIQVRGNRISEDRPKGRQSSQGYRPDLPEGRMLSTPTADPEPPPTGASGPGRPSLTASRQPTPRESEPQSPRPNPPPNGAVAQTGPESLLAPPPSAPPSPCARKMKSPRELRSSLHQESHDTQVRGNRISEDRPKGRRSSQGYRPDRVETMRHLTQSPAILLLFITCVLLDVITTAQGVEINLTQCIQQRQLHPLHVSCVDICSAGRCTYTVPHGLTELNDKDCGLYWNDQDGVLIADPAQPDKLYPPAVEVTPAHLITKDCVDGVWVEITRRGTWGACKVQFRVPDVAEYEQREADRDEKSTAAAGRFWTGLIVGGIIGGIAVVILCVVFGIWCPHLIRGSANGAGAMKNGVARSVVVIEMEPLQSDADNNHLPNSTENNHQPELRS